MTSTLAPIAPRLAKIIPRLASDQPGEIVATVAAIGRTLNASGLDWHDLAAALGESPPSPTRRVDPEPPWWSQRQQAQWLSTRLDLAPHEARFVRDMVLATASRRHLSDRQAEWLEALYHREWKRQR